jgi:glycolate oxidase FAD binding subunit
VITETITRHFEASSPLEIRGGGSKRFFGRTDVPLPVLDLSSHAGVMAYEPKELMIRLKGGTPLSTVESALKAEGQWLGFEPPNIGKRSTIGGAIASGWSGPRRPFYGAARDFVLGVGLVTGEGKYLEFGGQVMKNVAGFDVSRLVVGAMGTLGVIADVSLKVLPAPEVEETRVFEMDRLDAHGKMIEWSGRSLPISGLAFSAGRLYVRLSGTELGVAAARIVLGGEADQGTFWERLRNLDLFQHADRLWRVSVPATSPSLLQTCDVIDWGGSQRWCVDPASDPREGLTTGHATEVWNRSSDLPRQAFQPLPAVLLKLHQRLKQTFDPRGILNPGRMYGEL